MKNLLTFGILMVFILACEQVTCGCVQPETNSSFIDGKWKLVKISYGYPAPNMPTFTTTVDDISYEFNSQKKTYSYSKDGKVIENGTFALGVLNRGGGVMEQKISFSVNNMYSTYTVSADFNEISLYQPTHEGVILADGNTFHYQKVK